MKNPTKAFGYLRVSGKGQLAGDGFPRQRKAIQDYAKKHGFEIVQYYEEKGVSGTLEHREALDRLLVDLMADGVKAVIVEKLDRLSRELRIQETLIHEYFTNRFKLISTCEPDLGSSDPNRVFMRQIFGAVAQLDKSNIVLKLRAARQRIREKNGHCEGRKPFGVRDGERETVNQIIAMRSTGQSYELIAETLNKRGVKARKNVWYPTSIRRVVVANS